MQGMVTRKVWDGKVWGANQRISVSEALMVNTFNGAWANTGAISETGSIVNLGGTFTLAQLGAINRSAGTINLTGTLTNTGTTFALNASTGSWNLAGGTINGPFAAGAPCVPT